MYQHEQTLSQSCPYNGILTIVCISPLLDDAGELPDSPALLPQHVLSPSGHDDDLSPSGSHTDLSIENNKIKKRWVQ